jgi:hypothetical protein
VVIIKICGNCVQNFNNKANCKKKNRKKATTSTKSKPTRSEEFFSLLLIYGRLLIIYKCMFLFKSATSSKDEYIVETRIFFLVLYVRVLGRWLRAIMLCLLIAQTKDIDPPKSFKFFQSCESIGAITLIIATATSFGAHNVQGRFHHGQDIGSEILFESVA